MQETDKSCVRFQEQDITNEWGEKKNNEWKITKMSWVTEAKSVAQVFRRDEWSPVWTMINGRHCPFALSCTTIHLLCNEGREEEYIDHGHCNHIQVEVIRIAHSLYFFFMLITRLQCSVILICFLTFLQTFFSTKNCNQHGQNHDMQFSYKEEDNRQWRKEGYGKMDWYLTDLTSKEENGLLWNISRLEIQFFTTVLTL